MSKSYTKSRSLINHNYPIPPRVVAGLENAGSAMDLELSMTSTSPGHRCNTKLEELRWHLEKLPQGFPEVSREHIMANLPLTVLAISGVGLCKPNHINSLNRYLQTAVFRYAMIHSKPGYIQPKLEVGNGSLIEIPYALNPNVEFSPAGKMLWYMHRETTHSFAFKTEYMRICVLQQLEWIIWNSKK